LYLKIINIGIGYAISQRDSENMIQLCEVDITRELHCFTVGTFMSK